MLRAFLSVAILAVPARAAGQVVEAEPATSDPVPPATSEPEPDRPRGWQLELGGRLFLRDTLSRIDAGESVWRHDRDLDQARVSLDYERERLRISIEVELGGGDADLKDTTIQLEPVDALRIKAGRFKVPMSFLGLESKWRVPSQERGILGELELDDRDLPFAGARADGLSVELRPEVVMEPRFTLAAFQSPLAGGVATVDPTEELTQDLYARVEVEPLPGLHAAASVAWVAYLQEIGVADDVRNLPMGSAEVHIDSQVVRVWLEGFAGRSFVYPASGTLSGMFVAARALIAPRFDRPVAGMWRLEPYASASVLDASTDQDGDRVSEIVGGANLAFSKHWRLQLEMAERFAQGIESPVADSTLIRVQLGARFAEKVE